jgi:hypothetical protein
MGHHNNNHCPHEFNGITADTYYPENKDGLVVIRGNMRSNFSPVGRFFSSQDGG